jgi:hypothetical protein
MNPFEVIVLIGLAIIVYVLFRAKHFSSMSIGAPEVDNPGIRSGRESELEREVEELRERLHVLERIATEDTEAKRLSAEIESLREDKGKVQ